MISSAVVIPEEQSVPDTTSLKRRQSSFSGDANKRSRIETQNSFEPGQEDQHGKPNQTTSPLRRKSSAVGVGAVEERKRGQRLFGALLGTLSQTSSKSAHKKRDEIEQRQRERLRKENEEREAVARRKRTELIQIRKVEQEAWDKASLKVRHHNMRAMAHFLRTKAEPSLYYRPWDLRREEEEIIRNQIDEVENDIEKNSNNPNNGGQYVNGKTEEATLDVATDESSIQQSLDEAMSKAQGKTGSNEADPQSPEQPISADNYSRERTADNQKDDDRGGEELVEGQEDDVMY